MHYKFVDSDGRCCKPHRFEIRQNASALPQVTDNFSAECCGTSCSGVLSFLPICSHSKSEVLLLCHDVTIECRVQVTVTFSPVPYLPTYLAACNPHKRLAA